MKERGTIVDISGDEISIEMEPGKECSKCRVCDLSGIRKISVGEGVAASLKPGDKVEIEIAPNEMIIIYLLLYGFPLGVFMATLILGNTLFESPPLSFILAVFITVAAMVFPRAYIRKLKWARPLVRRVE